MAAKERGGPGRSRDPEIILARCVVDGVIVHWPARQAKQLVVLDWLVQRFEPGLRYPEFEVNELILPAHEDTAAMRRYLIDHGMLHRVDGTYWRSGGTVDL